MAKAKIRLDLELSKVIELEVPDNLTEQERRNFLIETLNEMKENNDPMLQLDQQADKIGLSAKLEKYWILYNLDKKEF